MIINFLFESSNHIQCSNKEKKTFVEQKSISSKKQLSSETFLEITIILGDILVMWNIFSRRMFNMLSRLSNEKRMPTDMIVNEPGIYSKTYDKMY